MAELFQGLRETEGQLARSNDFDIRQPANLFPKLFCSAGILWPDDLLKLLKTESCFNISSLYLLPYLIQQTLIFYEMQMMDNVNNKQHQPMSKQSIKRLIYLIIYTFNLCYYPLKDSEELAIRQGVVYVLFTICPKYIRMIMIKSTLMCNSQNIIPRTLQTDFFVPSLAMF